MSQNLTQNISGTLAGRLNRLQPGAQTSFLAKNASQQRQRFLLVKTNMINKHLSLKPGPQTIVKESQNVG